MDLIKVKTARFRDIVDQCGAPEALTLWQAPSEDKALKRAVREHRVMSVHQAVTGGKKDFAEVGLVTKGNMLLLVFPKSLKQFQGRRVVGIDYDLLKQPEAAAPLAPTAMPRQEGARSGGVKPSKKKALMPEALDSAVADSEPLPPPVPQLDPFMTAAILEAQKGLHEGGIPIGSALVRKGKLVAVGHNKRVQDNDPVTHAETDCLRNAGRLGSFRGCTLYSTLMPCYFCAGAAVQFGIAKVIVGESRTFPGAPEFMRQHGIEVIDLDLPECYEMMECFIRDHPRLWNEDIGAE